MDKGGGGGARSELARQCRLSCLSTVLQLVVAALFVLASLWLASLLLEVVRVLGITTVPPGVLYVDYDSRQ